MKILCKNSCVFENKHFSLFFFQPIAKLTVQVGEIVDVRHDVVRILREFFEAEFENSEGDFLVFAAVVLHEGSRSVHVELRPVVFSRLLEHVPSGLNALRSPGKFHVLNVRLRKGVANEYIHPFVN